MQYSEITRYTLNGLIATAVHYGLLVVFIEWFRFDLVGVANLLAAMCGIVVSFLGNRLFVFGNVEEHWLVQATRFGLLYALIAVIHGVILYGWTDIYGFNYHFGFLLATCVQFVSSYLGNKRLVFQS